MTAFTDTYWCMITVMPQALHISGSEVNQYSTDILALQTWQEYLAERRTRNSVERGGKPIALFTCGLVVSQRVCLRLAFVVKNSIILHMKLCPCPANKSYLQANKSETNCKQIKVKLTASKQCVRHLAFCAYYPCRVKHKTLRKR